MKTMVLVAESPEVRMILYPMGAACSFELDDWLTDTALRTAAGITAFCACDGDRARGGDGVRFRFVPIEEAMFGALKIVMSPEANGVPLTHVVLWRKTLAGDDYYRLRTGVRKKRTEAPVTAYMALQGSMVDDVVTKYAFVNDRQEAYFIPQSVEIAGVLTVIASSNLSGKRFERWRESPVRIVSLNSLDKLVKKGYVDVTQELTRVFRRWLEENVDDPVSQERRAVASPDSPFAMAVRERLLEAKNRDARIASDLDVLVRGVENLQIALAEPMLDADVDVGAGNYDPTVWSGYTELHTERNISISP